MFRKILIANRGEIACRVMRTAQRMAIRTVAVYSQADARALHVAIADEAVCIGPPPARESYLAAARITAAARERGAEAIHPGYGFLSENEDFAAACAAAGIAFIGPPPDAIRAMGSKSAAKRIMERASVPLVPGYHGEEQDAARLAAEAARIGFPVLIKATAGGGGKGMRIVRHAGEFADALASCKREAASAFGDDRVLVERYLERARHIEIQVFADTHGNAVHLFERDCSMQRRHQKVIEEAPAPGMNDERRARMGAAAVAAARAVGYVGAGTVEFVAGPEGDFYFMEMNTRLQVEHPVTEMITGTDLVEWQLRVAAGEPLPRRQAELAIHGHAIEVRIYAEDADRDFLPQTGTIRHLARPEQSAHVRIDSGVRAGDEISPHYDPMIAKLIVHDHDRESALERLRAALAEFQIVGLTTNIDFLARLAGSASFASGHFDTGTIARERESLAPTGAPASERVIALAIHFELARLARTVRAATLASSDPYSPWSANDGWRLNLESHHVFVYADGDRHVAVTVHYRAEGVEIELAGGARRSLSGRIDGDTVQVWLGEEALHGNVIADGAERIVFHAGTRHTLVLHDPLAQEVDAEAHAGGLVAPMPGKVIAVMVAAGTTVERGTPLVILEAMKMEHTITAPAAGTVKEILYQVGEQVPEGAELIAFERA